jgi:drug/metabolite transporter (DMT)-like permease
MSAVPIAVVLSLVSAVAYAAAAVCQERLAARAGGTGTLRLLRSGAWWWSVVLNGSGALLHVVALKYGPLTVVQPLGALTLVAAVPLGALTAGRRVAAVEWRGTVCTLAGLAALLVAAAGPAPRQVLSPGQALAVAGATAALIGVLSRPGARPGLRHATASGVASGVASALTQTVTVAATDHTGPLLSARVIVVTLLVAVFAAGGLLLSQTAYRGGLGAPLAVVTLANPVAAAVIGITLLGQGLQGGALGVVLALAGAALASWGVVDLSRAPRPGAPSGPTRPEPSRPAAADALEADGQDGGPDTETRGRGTGHPVTTLRPRQEQAAPPAPRGPGLRPPGDPAAAAAGPSGPSGSCPARTA